MKHLLRFKTFLLMAVISLLAGTSAWAQSDFSATETSNVTLTAGTNGSTCTVNGKDGIKVGTSKAGGDMSVTVPAGTTHLHVHAAAWKGVTGLSLNISGATTSPSSIDLTADSGVSNNSPFTLRGRASSYYFVVELSNITAETTLKFTSSTGKRFVVWGVNAETVTSGGSTHKDNDLALTGDPVALSFDLYNNATPQVINYTTSSTGEVTVADNEYATFVVDQTNKTITVTPTVVTPSTQTITVNQAADDTYKAGSVTFTINVTNSNPAVNNISDITAAGTYKVRGTIVAKSQRGFIVGDGTGYVYYYNQNYTQADYNIGDMVELNGSVVAYGGVFEFNNTTTVTAATSSNYVAENPTVLSGSDMDTRVASTTPTQLSSYVQYEGTLTVSGTYYNITSIDGASTAMGSISYPLNTDFTSLNGKKVKVTGYYVGISSSKYYNTMIGSIEEVVVTTPTLTVEPAVVNVPYTGGNGDFTVSPSNVDNAYGAYITYYDPANTENTASSDPEWLNVGYDYSNLSLSYSVTEENTTGAARTACFKYSVMCDGGVALSNMITVTQAAYIADYATLPFTFDGGRADIETTAGLTQEGLDSDYASSPKLKFNGTGDYVILKFNERPGTLTFDIKGNSFSGGTFTVQTSEDGVTYTDLETYDALADMQSEELNNLGEDVRYIKWVYTEKSSGNVALGNIALKKYTDTPVVVVAAPTFDPAGMEVEAGFVVTITSEVGTVISYTTDGTDPAESATAVITDTNTASVEVNADMTIRAIALDNELNQSEEVSESYTVAAPVVVVGVPVITVDNGLITIIPGSDNAQVIYTTDGTDPTYEPLNGTVYTEPFNITVDTTIKAIGVDNNGNVSEVVTIEASAEVVDGVKYYKVTSTDQLEEGVDYLLVYEGEAGEGAAAYGGLNSYTTNSIGKSVALKHIGGSVVTITDEEVVPVTLKSRSKDGTKWAMRDANGWIAAVNGNNLHGDKTEDDAVWTFDFTADANKQIFHEFTGSTTSTRYLQYNTSSPRFAGYTGSQSAVYLYKAATYNVSVGATGYATLYYGTKNLVVPENVEAYTYTVNNGKLEESYLYSTNEVIPAGTGVVLKAPAGEYKFAVTTEAGLEDTDNLLFGFDEPSTTVAPAAGDYLFYLLGVDNGKVGFYWGMAKGAAFTSGAHKAYLAVPTEQASGLRGFSFDGSVVGINTIGVDMPEGNAYDLQGRRVQQFQKNGLYIVDGKKVLAK